MLVGKFVRPPPGYKQQPTQQASGPAVTRVKVISAKTAEGLIPVGVVHPEMLPEDALFAVAQKTKISPDLLSLSEVAVIG